MQEFVIGVYALFAIGSFLVILGFLGCCGAIRESSCMLCTFFVLMLCIIVIQVGGGAQVWSQSEPIKNSVSAQDEEISVRANLHLTLMKVLCRSHEGLCSSLFLALAGIQTTANSTFIADQETALFHNPRGVLADGLRKLLQCAR